MHRTKARGFTLVEILVVLGILTLLSSLLMAGFVRVRERGRQISCESNLQQIGLAMQQYLQDSGGVYPPAPKFEKPLASYIKSTQVLQCPTESHPVQVTPNDYYMNARLNTMDFVGRRMLGRHEATVANPAQTFLCSDLTEENKACEGQSECGEDAYYGRHSGGSNFSFLDGHVKWLSPHASNEIMPNS